MGKGEAQTQLLNGRVAESSSARADNNRNGILYLVTIVVAAAAAPAPAKKNKIECQLSVASLCVARLSHARPHACMRVECGLWRAVRGHFRRWNLVVNSFGAFDQTQTEREKKVPERNLLVSLDLCACDGIYVVYGRMVCGVTAAQSASATVSAANTQKNVVQNARFALYILLSGHVRGSGYVWVDLIEPKRCVCECMSATADSMYLKMT